MLPATAIQPFPVEKGTTWEQRGMQPRKQVRLRRGPREGGSAHQWCCRRSRLRPLIPGTAGATPRRLPDARSAPPAAAPGPAAVPLRLLPAVHIARGCRAVGQTPVSCHAAAAGSCAEADTGRPSQATISSWACQRMAPERRSQASAASETAAEATGGSKPVRPVKV